MDGGSERGVDHLDTVFGDSKSTVIYFGNFDPTKVYTIKYDWQDFWNTWDDVVMPKARKLTNESLEVVPAKFEKETWSEWVTSSVNPGFAALTEFARNSARQLIQALQQGKQEERKTTTWRSV